MSVNADALNILKTRKYLHDKKNGEQEIPEEMFKRVADHVYAAEERMDGFDRDDMRKAKREAFEAMCGLEFMPNTPCLVNAGTKRGNLSACFVLPLEDTLESIHKAHEMQFFIQATGGGTGFNLSPIRPRGSPAGDLDMETNGPVNWLRWLNENANTVMQRMRKGANMGILDITHPDIREFISCKEIDGEIKHFNISVSVHDEIMQYFSNNDDLYIKLKHNNDKRKHENLIDGQKLFNEICRYAWLTGDPGLYFVDRVNKDNPLFNFLGPIKCSNPCGEVHMHPRDVCNLGHINLSLLVEHGKFMMSKFKKLIKIGTRFLDNVVEANILPFPEIKEMNMNTRRIGLGIMGWHGALIKMGIPYDSEAALNMVDVIGAAWRETLLQASIELANIRGPYPLFEHADANAPRVRNAWRGMIAPTGTTSLIAGCESSIEPRYNAAIYHNHSGEKWVDVWSELKTALNGRGITNGVLEQLKTTDRIRNIKGIPDDIKELFGVAHDIAPKDHIRMLAAWQKYADVGISKTINMPNEATEADIKEAYILAWQLGCKAITIYRDGSKQQQVLSSGKAQKATIPKLADSPAVSAAEVSAEAMLSSPIIPPTRVPIERSTSRPPITKGSQRKIPTGYGNMLVYIGHDDFKVPIEIVAKIGKSGGEMPAHLEGLSRMISKFLRASFDTSIPTEERIFKVVDSVIKQLKGIRCDQVAWYKSPYQDKPITILSVEDGMARALMEWKLERIMAGTSDIKIPDAEDYDDQYQTCPECKSTNLRNEEGCMKCPECGFSKC